MISSMRNNMQSNFYKYVLWVLLFSLVGGSALVSVISFFFPKKDTTSVYAEVNGTPISRRAVARTVAQEEEQVRMLKRMYGFDLSEQLATMGSPEARAFDSLTKNVLIQSAAQKAGLDYFSQEQLVATLANPEFLMQVLGAQLGSQVYDQDGNIRWDMIDYLLRQQGLSMDDFENMLKETLQKNLVLGIASHALYIPTIALKELYIQKYAQKSFSYIMLPFEKYLKKVQKTGAVEKELQAFYREQNVASRRYWKAEKRAGLVWVFDPNAYNLRITDKDIQLYYTRNRSNYMQKPAVYTVRSLHFGADAYDVAQSVAEQLAQDPTAFENLFAQYKGIDGTVSSESGADSALVKALDGIAKNGELSSLFETKDGWEIVKRIKRKAPEYKKLEAVRSQIADKLTADKFKKRFVLDAGMVGKQIKRDKKALDRFVTNKKARKTSLPLTDMVSANNDNRRFIKELFGLRKDGTKAFVDGQKGYLVVLAEKEDAQRLPYKDVAEQVKQDYFAQQAKAAINKEAVQVQERIRTGASLADTAKALGFAVKTRDKITGEDADVWEKLSKEGLPVAAMQEAIHVGDILVGQSEGDHSGSVVELSAIEKIDESDVTAKKDELAQQISQDGLRLYIEGFIASLKENATIKMYNKMTR